MMEAFDAMLEMFGSAIAEGKTPRRWEINQPAKMHLIMDDRIMRDNLQGLLESRPLLGIPVSLIEKWDNDPMVYLFVGNEEKISLAAQMKIQAGRGE